MADRTIRMILKAEVADFKRQMAEAAASMDKIPANASKTETALGSMVQSARYNREAWTTAGTAIAGFGVAILAVGAAAVKTGVSYNTLQQTTRAALTTLLGSAQAANAQMDKLDDFARNSPFAKQVFITAQQQLLGFGVTANKVLPALDAIQNAVAAMGGSNDQIAAIADILARIKSEGRLSGDALQRLGYYGIDAAQLIGSQMGMTSGQIRDMASKPGGIPVDQMWDPLVNGMMDKFGGAAANVKNTFAGAIDRVKAAWRDFSGMIAEPLVGSEGGGAFVGLLNGAADVMRAFQALPDPVRNVSLGVVGLTGVAATLGGGFMVMAPRILDTVDALKTMHLWTKNVGIGVGVAAGALVAATIVFSVWSSAQAEAKARADALAATLDKVTGAIGENTREVVSNQLAAKTGWWILQKDSVFNSAEKIGVGLDIVTDAALGSADAMAQVEAQIAAGNEAIRAGQWGEYADSIGQAGLGADDFISASMNLRERLAEQNGALEDGTNATRQAADAQGAASVSAVALADAVQYVGMSTEDATKVLDEWRSMVAKSDASFISLTDGYQAVIDKNTEWAQATADSTESADDSWETYYNGVDVSVADFIAQLQAQVDAQTAWETNMTALTTKAREGMTTQMATAADEMIAELMALGPEGAAQVALMASMTDEEFATVVTLWGQKGTAATAAFVAGSEALAAPVIEVTANMAPAYSQVASFITATNGLRIGVNAAGQQVSFTTKSGGKGNATGGILPGAPSSKDNMFIRAASGEFVVNAWATARNRSTLEGINAGLPGYAGGGAVQPAYAPWAMAGTGSSTAMRAPSLAGLSIEGTLDLGNGLVGVMRGVVRSELSSEASAVRARPRR